MEALLDELIALVKTQQKKCRRHGLTEEINEVKSRILHRADLVEGLVKAARKAVDKHRELPNVGCPEDCWCWDLDNAISKYEAKLKD